MLHKISWYSFNCVIEIYRVFLNDRNNLIGKNFSFYSFTFPRGFMVGWIIRVFQLNISSLLLPTYITYFTMRTTIRLNSIHFLCYNYGFSIPTQNLTSSQILNRAYCNCFIAIWLISDENGLTAGKVTILAGDSAISGQFSLKPFVSHNNSESGIVSASFPCNYSKPFKQMVEK